MKKSESRQTLGKVLRYIGAYRFLLLLSMLLAAGTVILSLYIPILFGDAIDGMIGAGQVDWDGITALLVKTGVLAALCALMQWVMNTVNNRITYHVVRDILHLLRRGLRRADRHAAVDLHRVRRDALAIQLLTQGHPQRRLSGGRRAGDHHNFRRHL